MAYDPGEDEEKHGEEKIPFTQYPSAPKHTHLHVLTQKNHEKQRKVF